MLNSLFPEIKRILILLVSVLFADILIAQGNDKKASVLRLDTVVFIGNKDFDAGMFFYKELAYSYFDSTVYFLATADCKQKSITIHTYDQNQKAFDSIVCPVDPSIF